VLAPEHPAVASLKNSISNFSEVENYVAKAKNKTELERMENKEKTGVLLKGVKAVNPANGEEIPVFAADYVLAGYGAGAIMGVPAHDERDWEFAKKRGIKIVSVVKPENERSKKSGSKAKIEESDVFVEDGININSGFLDGLATKEAKEKIIFWLEEKKFGRRKTTYKMRDWLVSRQRYWGAPIPIVYCPKCGETPVPEDRLPVELPDDVDFKPTGESPLVYSKKFQEAKCPLCGSPAKRESDTMDTFVCSSWYYLRYSDPKNDQAFASPERLKKWLPVDVYVGGAEHTVLHLLYSRFFTKALQKLGYLEFNEPFLKLRHQGIILGEDGNKMSKSKGNVINPDEVVEKFGADSLRMYEMFMGPLEDMKPWNTKGIVGVRRFLDKVWVFGAEKENYSSATAKEISAALNKTIKKVTEDINAFKFNTAIAQMMIFVNELAKAKHIARDDWEKFLLILSPFAPHLSEELWELSGHNKSIFTEQWPRYDPRLARDEEVELVVQVNGKVRDRIRVSAEIGEEEAKKIALASEAVGKWLEGREVKKIVFVQGRLVSIVI